MSEDHDQPDVRAAAGGTLEFDDTDPVAPPTAHAAAPVDVAIRNRNRGQLVEVDVRGPWTERALEERLLHLVSVRQPAAVAVVLEDRGHGEPALVRARALIEDFGGTLTVTIAARPASLDPAPG